MPGLFDHHRIQSFRFGINREVSEISIASNRMERIANRFGGSRHRRIVAPSITSSILHHTFHLTNELVVNLRDRTSRVLQISPNSCGREWCLAREEGILCLLLTGVSMKQNPPRCVFLRRSVSRGDVRVAWSAADGEWRPEEPVSRRVGGRREERASGRREEEAHVAGRQSAAAKTAGYDTTSPTVATRLNFQPGRRSSLETAAPPASARKLLGRLPDRVYLLPVLISLVVGARRRKITFHPIRTTGPLLLPPLSLRHGAPVPRVSRVSRVLLAG